MGHCAARQPHKLWLVCVGGGGGDAAARLRRSTCAHAGARVHMHERMQVCVGVHFRAGEYDAGGGVGGFPCKLNNCAGLHASHAVRMCLMHASRRASNLTDRSSTMPPSAPSPQPHSYSGNHSAAPHGAPHSRGATRGGAMPRLSCTRPSHLSCPFSCAPCHAKGPRCPTRCPPPMSLPKPAARRMHKQQGPPPPPCACCTHTWRPCPNLAAPAPCTNKRPATPTPAHSHTLQAHPRSAAGGAQAMRLNWVMVTRPDEPGSNGLPGSSPLKRGVR